MSNIFLNTIAQSISEKAVKGMIEKYNDPDLTPKGKLEVLEICFFHHYINGYNLCQENEGKLKAALTTLVDLKNYKKEKGSDEFYETNKEIAWKCANRLLEELK